MGDAAAPQSMREARIRQLREDIISEVDPRLLDKTQWYSETERRFSLGQASGRIDTALKSAALGKLLDDQDSEIDRLRQIVEDAPHNGFCNSLYSPTWPCTCWKAAVSRPITETKEQTDDHQ